MPNSFPRPFPRSIAEGDEIAKLSSYPELQKPVFHDNIPAHLLQNVDDHTKFVITQLSTISQQNEWLIDAAVNTNAQVRHTNGRLLKLEDWKKPLDEKGLLNKLSTLDKFFNFWTILVAIILTIGSIGGVIFSILEHLHLI